MICFVYLLLSTMYRTKKNIIILVKEICFAIIDYTIKVKFKKVNQSF